ncbi:MAG TPA: hypothetical protein VFB62_21160, partial [Polyangiaceae bacterium]|nr:hypothetical protein [Polyangiaceae bacterium]
MFARWLIAPLLTLAGCSGCGADADKGKPAPAGTTADGQREVVSLIDALRTCDVDHRGLLIDLGTDALVGRFRNRLDAPAGLEVTQHDGATWSRVRERDLHLSFYVPKVAPVFVAARAIGHASDRVSISIDGSMLGTVKLGRDEIRTAATSVTTLPMDAGNHTLTLHFHGRAKSESDPFAELDWIRIGSPDELERTYGAPTQQDILAPAAELAGVPHRAVALRAPGVIRCPLRVPPNGKLRVSVGMRGAGTATAHVALVTDQKEKVIERAQVNGGPDARWTDLEISLGDHASQIAFLELRAERTTGTGRLLFGDPTLLVPAREPPRTPTARAAIVVVLTGVHKTDLPPWRETETPHLRTLNRLVRDATVFDDHRAPSTLVAAIMASLVSGLSPYHHMLSDSGARLPASVPTLAGMARDGSVPAA